jgi:hypothetical protein
MNLFVCKAVKPASRLRPAPAFKRLFTILVENGNLLRPESPELEEGLAAHFTDLQEDLPAEVAEKRRRARRENHWLGREIRLELYRSSTGNRKGRDIGYALAASSCEGANNVESCTITAFDVITAFAVPNPGHSSQTSRIFRVRSLPELPR